MMRLGESMCADVSIIIPCYNDGHFLRETIASVEFARTSRLRDVIIVDDGSTELATLEVLLDLRKAGYSVIRQPNRGTGAARNTGIRSAGGQYILPVDSDNRIRKVYLTRAIELLDADSAVGVVYGDAEYFGEKTGRWNVAEFNLFQLVLKNFIDNCAVFRKSVWEEIGGYDEHIPFMGWEDWDLWLRAALRGWRFVHLREVAFDYRVRTGSQLSGADKHASENYRHIFSKKELVGIGLLRPELLRLKSIENSFDYRLGRRLADPLRKVQNTFRRVMDVVR
jgi:glycosyltransferase involved in cell wall biosynthesis